MSYPLTWKMLHMPDSPNLAAELQFVKALAVEAAAVAMKRCQKVTPQEKANLSYVTDLDQDLERLIRGRLGEKFPDDSLTGEEYETEGGTGPRRWSIDPIDGTGNMVHGLPLWAISIGLIVAGEPVLGVIAIPPLNELFWAVKGAGAWLDGRPLRAHCGPSIRAPCRAACATWEAPAASRRSSPPTGFRPPRSWASTLTISPRESSLPPKRAVRSLQSWANGSPQPKWCAARRFPSQPSSLRLGVSMPSWPLHEHLCRRMPVVRRRSIENQS
jgi:Inositol monophosphatase family